MNKNFIAKGILSLTLFTGITLGFVSNATALETDNNTQVSTYSNLEKINPSENFEKSADFNQTFTKKQAIEDINYILKTISQHHVTCINGLPEKILKQKEIEI